MLQQSCSSAVLSFPFIVKSYHLCWSHWSHYSLRMYVQFLSGLVRLEKRFQLFRFCLQNYEKPLLTEQPNIAHKSSVKVIFYKVRDILQCHNMFSIELAEYVKNWDRDEKIGHCFTASVGSAKYQDG